jgi:hypothetical protein
MFLPACTVTTEITRTEGGGYVVKSKRNALVVIKGDQAVIDNRNHWYLEMLLSSALARSNNSIHVELENLDDKEED